MVIVAPSAGAATFNTALSDVDWQVASSILECKLSQPISGFGQAIFSRRAGEAEDFYLQQKQILMPVGSATISLSRPAWQQADNFPEAVAERNVVAEPVPLRIDDSLVTRLQAELLKGLRIIITRSLGDERHNPVRVVIEPLRFRTALADYQACLQQLLPVSYAEASRTTLQFDSASDELTADERRKLDWVARYTKEDASIKRVLVDGHTDSVGPRPKNMNIAKSRSERIAAYLVSLGVDEAKIITRWHGERYPIATNATEQGRRKNRRVTVRLER